MQERFLRPTHFIQKRDHVFDVSLGVDRLLKVGGSREHRVLALCVLKNFVLLRIVNVAGIDVERHVFFVPEAGQNCLIGGHRRILTDRPDAPIGVAKYEIIGEKLNGRGSDHIKEILDLHLCLIHLYGDLLFLFQVLIPPKMKNRPTFL